MTPATRSTLILLAVVFAVAVPSLQVAYQFGMSAAEFSYQGNGTLRVEGFAFAIWGLLYLGMIIYALYQALPVTRASETLAIYAWPSFVAISGCGLWILMAALNQIWMTVVVISVSAAALILALLQAQGGGTLRDRLLIALPLNLLAGWLTIASIVNVVTVLTIERIITPDIATMSGLVAVGGATLLAATVALSGRSALYLLPIIWGLYGVRVAEGTRQPLLSDAAGVAVLLLGSLAVTMILMRLIPLDSAQRAGRKG